VSKLLASLALTGLLVVGLASTSSALTFTVTQPSGTVSNATSDNFDMAGVTTNGGTDTTTFTASLNPALLPQDFLGDSSVSFGVTTQSGAAGHGSYTNVATNFTFDLTVPIAGLTRSFAVQGLINGTSDFDGVNGASKAKFSPVTILVDGLVTPTVVATSPAGRVSLEIAGLSFGATKVDVFFDSIDALTAPGPNSLLSIGGFVRSTPVPEPGTLALLAGMGVSGSLFLGRKRRRA
jgi:hypothetical protein